VTETGALIADRYRLVTALARGGMGVVWKGWDERLQREVAVKQLRLAPGLSPAEAATARDRAMREARLTARLHHPHAVPVYDVVEHDGQPCLIMQFLPSISLQEAVRRRGTLPPAEVAGIGSQIASALTAAHHAGVVHRDVKPGNVLLADSGDVKLTDFGISQALGDATLTATGMVTGTPAYLAPEVARGDPASFASDVFSLGATLYTATEGNPPFGQDDNAMAVLHRVASGQLRPPERSGALTPLLLRMLSNDPAQRPDMVEVGHTLTALHSDIAALRTAREDRASLSTTRLPAVTPPPVAQPAADRGEVGQPSDARRQPEAPAPTRTDLPRMVGSAAVPASQPRPSRPDRTAGPGMPPVAARPGGSGPARPSRRNRRGPWIAALVVLLVIGAVAIAVALANRSNTPTAGRSTGGSAGSTGSSSQASSSTSPSSGPAQTTPASSTPASGTSPATPTPTPTVASGTAATLAKSITSYYALIPSDLQAGWQRLTPTYRRTTAGGFNGYRDFWGQVQRVSVANAIGRPPNTAEATITYFYKDGRVITERTSFNLVQDGGQWEINGTTVLGNQ